MRRTASRPGSPTPRAASPSRPWPLTVLLVTTMTLVACNAPANGGRSGPAVPTNLTATPGEGHVLVSWHLADDAASTIVYRATANGRTGDANGVDYQQIANVDAPRSTYRDENVAPNTSYWYAVRATSANGRYSDYVETRNPTSPGATTYELVVNLQGDGSGRVESAPAGIECGSTCTSTFEAGTTITLTAIPDGDATFAGWSDCDTTHGPECTVQMDEDRTVRATFEPATSATPAPVNDLRATAIASDEILLEWTSAPGGADRYWIYRRTASDGNCWGTYVFLDAIPGGRTSYTDTGLTPSTKYCYLMVTGLNGQHSELSVNASATTHR